MASSQSFPMMPGGQTEWEEAEVQLEDEFAWPEAARGLLLSAQPTVQRVFAVTFVIGGVEKQLSPGTEQFWVKMRGKKGNVQAAKLFVKGLINPEEQKEVSYPEGLHCVFAGARGLFMDSLIRNTSAHIVVGSIGSLLITGLTEPVVQAYSFIFILVEKYKSSEEQHSEMGPAASESQDSSWAFKAIVGHWDDHYTPELLYLPGGVKEILLNVVKEARRDTVAESINAVRRHTPGDTLRLRKGCQNFEDPNMNMEKGMEQSSDRDPHSSMCHNILPMPLTQSVPGVTGERGERLIGGERRRDGDVSKETDPHNPFFCAPCRDVGFQERFGLESHMPQEMGEEEGLALSMDSREEFGLQLNFFTAMGYSEDVVRKVLARPGPKEVSQILDLVQQEQDKEAKERRERKPQIATINTALDVRRCEEGGALGQVESDENESGRVEQGALMGYEEGNSMPEGEDFVLGVLKRAAAKCGYPEEKVMEVYSNLPGLSTAELLEELQKDTQQAKGGEKQRSVGGKKERAYTDPQEKLGVARLQEEFSVMELKQGEWSRVRNERRPNQKISGESVADDKAASFLPSHIQGPPETTYPLKVMSGFIDHSHDIARSKVGDKTANAATVTMVTGEQRFHDGLLMPFDLKLTDDPADPNLCQVIIDGSNIAMSHGLGLFFSCRGIAIAVQYFWNRGHRKITTFVPQWRQKMDPKVKEKHYLTELQKLGLLCFTPSREVEGKRISSYDDRFLLDLAQHTDGVIVTNDNLRDLLDESPAWRDIIKKRLLQYTFVGDHFMVPDDPLGRGGPHLKDFLRSQYRTPVPGNHSFVGLASTPRPSFPFHAQTEVLQYRDQTVGSQSFWKKTVDSGRWRGRGRGAGRGRGGIRVDPEDAAMGKERTVAETASLREGLSQVFPGQDSLVTMALSCNPCLTDINSLSDIILELLEEKTGEN